VKRAKFAGPSGESYHVLSFLCCRFDVIVYFFYWLFSCFSSRGHHSRHTRPHTHTQTLKGTEKLLTHHAPADAGLIHFDFRAGIFFFSFFDILNFGLGIQMYAGPL
jgi:hypothetical protein